MIDEKKYEGHTEGKWRVSARKGTFTVKKGEYEVAAVNDYPNAQLIADAPLLLAEVKRLREEMRRLYDAWFDDEGMSQDAHETLMVELFVELMG